MQPNSTPLLAALCRWLWTAAWSNAVSRKALSTAVAGEAAPRSLPSGSETDSLAGTGRHVWATMIKPKAYALSLCHVGCRAGSSPSAAAPVACAAELLGLSSLHCTC